VHRNILTWYRRSHPSAVLADKTSRPLNHLWAVWAQADLDDQSGFTRFTGFVGILANAICWTLESH